MGHLVDICGGNSGSPTVRESDGLAVGILTHGGDNPPACDAGGGLVNCSTTLGSAGLQPGACGIFPFMSGDEGMRGDDPCTPPPPNCACHGNMNGDGAINARDIQGLVSCYLGGSVAAPGCACADMTLDGQLTSADVTSFINSLITKAPCF